MSVTLPFVSVRGGRSMQAGQIKRKMCCNAIGQVLPVTVLRMTRCASYPHGDRIPTELLLRPLTFTIITSFKGRGPVYIKSPDTGYEKAIPLPPQKKMQQSANGPTATPNRNNYKLHFYSLSPILQSQRNAIVLPYDKKRGLPLCGSPPSYE